MSESFQVTIYSDKKGFQYLSEKDTDALKTIETDKYSVINISYANEFGDFYQSKTYFAKMSSLPLTSIGGSTASSTTSVQSAMSFFEFFLEGEYVTAVSSQACADLTEWLAKPKRIQADIRSKAIKDAQKYVEVFKGRALDVHSLQERTPGFPGSSNKCFANAALKQLLLEPGNQEIDLVKVPLFALPLTKSFLDLSAAFHNVRSGSGFC